MRTVRLYSLRLLCLTILCVGVNALADAPAGRYVINAGTIFDVKTGLTWQQSTVDYPNDTNFAWDNAKAACTGAWRLPTIRELQSIVDYSRSNPAVDPAFQMPATPPSCWSSTPDTRPPTPPFFFSTALQVNFGTGETLYVNVLSGGYCAICVK
jgi:hypothetical protein